MTVIAACLMLWFYRAACRAHDEGRMCDWLAARDHTEECMAGLIFGVPVDIMCTLSLLSSLGVIK